MSENKNEDVLDELLDELDETEDTAIEEAAELLKEAAENPSDEETAEESSENEENASEEVPEDTAENDSEETADDESEEISDDEADEEIPDESEFEEMLSEAENDVPKEYDIFADENDDESDDSDDEKEYAERPARRAPQQRRRPVNKGRKKKKKKRSGRLAGVLILTTFVIAASICLSLTIIAFGKDILGIGKSDTIKLLEVPEGASTAEIADMLEEEDIIRSPKCFVLFSRLRKSDELYIAGEHFVSANMAYEALINELTTIHMEEQETVEITFPEGINIYEAANKLEINDVCSASEFIFYFNSGGYGYSFESLLPTETKLKLNRMEGYVFPDTYYFTTNMKPEEVCQKIYKNFENKLSEERRAKMNELGMSLDELITFASIVQREAATTDTMATVASVFWNRLRNPDVFPLLQSDPTSNYANDVVRYHLEVYDKNIIDAYDTYVGAGLPPGAICNPGLEAIDAVLADIHTNYFYFMANIYTGRTEFSETLEEHEMYQAEIESEVDEYIASSEAAELEGNDE